MRGGFLVGDRRERSDGVLTNQNEETHNSISTSAARDASSRARSSIRTIFIIQKRELCRALAAFVQSIERFSFKRVFDSSSRRRHTCVRMRRIVARRALVDFRARPSLARIRARASEASSRRVTDAQTSKVVKTSSTRSFATHAMASEAELVTRVDANEARTTDEDARASLLRWYDANKRSLPWRRRGKQRKWIKIEALAEDAAHPMRRGAECRLLAPLRVPWRGVDVAPEASRTPSTTTRTDARRASATLPARAVEKLLFLLRLRRGDLLLARLPLLLGLLFAKRQSSLSLVRAQFVEQQADDGETDGDVNDFGLVEVEASLEFGAEGEAGEGGHGEDDADVLTEDEYEIHRARGRGMKRSRTRGCV